MGNVGGKARNVSVARGRLLERNRDIARDEMRTKKRVMVSMMVMVAPTVLRGIFKSLSDRRFGRDKRSAKRRQTTM